MHALSHSTVAVPCTRYCATDITPAPGIKGDSVGPLYHNTRARMCVGDRPYASYPHFQPGTRLITVILALQGSATRIPGVHFRVIEADHAQIIFTLLTLARLRLYRRYHYFNYGHAIPSRR